MIMGDFNAILSPNDKRSSFSVRRRCSLFGDFVRSIELKDMGFRDPSFTWQRGGTFERLDQALANDGWVTSFSNCLVSHSSRIKFDHRLLFLYMRLNSTILEVDPLII
ncbi:hypothetical protein ES332_A03G117300v1 [Gossypium tomentosum]|uniref:Endonuclease/exonuclease/phosphatase domain-containing protein n=1 Tax=Gossypium tomentosum TaxID=34277 RepID=A0A5D2R654_GOSTO|nr:hypothetical protein ES332_A03G117300v1 [Gossypium tomentosum]